ncbi:MAG TPA: hypothetical protein VN643_24005 [Pyrinomonadaceae bacterium]|nr:hypothetical protein [Pyrinomonadaceae bacterium]
MKKNSRKKQHLNSKPISRRKLVSGAVALVLLGAGLAFAFSRQEVDARNSAPAKSNAANYITRKVGNQTIQIDPQTGQIKPLTQEEAQRLAQGLKELANQSTEGLKQVPHADGSVTMDLEDRFQNVTLARRDAEGNVTTSCVDNPEAGAKFFGIDPKLVAPEKTNSAATKSPANQ